jgi:tetratricopeptide (TPR) repeat protein
MKPNDGPLLVSHAVASIGMKQFDQATADANQALSINPNDAAAYICRGMANRLTGKFQDALADFDRSISLNDKDYMAFSERGQTYMGLNQMDKAVVDFDHSLVLNPVNDTARAARGHVLLLKGNNAEGLVDVKNALDRNPNNQVAELGQGLAMLISGQYDRAIVALDQLVGKQPAFDAFVRTLRARAYLGKKDAAGAMTDLNLVLGTRPNDPDALSLRGIAFTSLKQYDKALDDLGKAIEQKPTIERYFARATAYEAKGDPDKATGDYRSATQMTPANVFDIAAQAQSKLKIQQLSKRTPCGSSGRGSKDDTCL